MSNFLQLVRNEHLKIYVKKSTWVMFALLAVIVLGMGLIVRFMADEDLASYGDNWQQELKQENEQLTAEMEQEEYMNFVNEHLISKNNYHLEQEIKPRSYDAWQFIYENTGFASLISLFTIIVAAGIIANEFKWGTIKQLLIRPVSRMKILLSKYVSVLLFSLEVLLFLMVFSLLLGIVLFGINGGTSLFISQGDSFEQINVIKDAFIRYGLHMVNLVMMATFAFMISAIFRSGGMAVSQYDWAKYILFANTNLSQYMGNSEPMIEGMTIGFSVVVLIVYYVIFLVASWLAFTKRDIAGQ